MDWRVETSGARVFRLNGWVLPERRREGIGRAILAWQERRVADISAAQSDDHPSELQAWASEIRPGKKELLSGAGFAPYSYIAEMLRPIGRDIPEAKLPEGIEVRPVTREHLRAIFEAENEATRDHVGHVEADEGDFQRFLTEEDFDPDLWRVAWEGDEVVGMVRSFIDQADNEELGRRRGFTEKISVRRPWRRRGIARALLLLSLEALAARGMEEATLDVHTDNPYRALRLYEDVGFEVNEMFAWYRKAGRRPPADPR
jgi:ribosomal protein S18 acetylase RimI-like enzyme